MPMDPGSTFLSTQAAKGAARLANGSAHFAMKQYRLHQLGKITETPTVIDELASFEDLLKTSESSLLVSFLCSAEFDRYCYEVAALHTLEKAGGEEHSASTGRLSASIFSAIPSLSQPLCQNIAEALAASVSSATAAALGASQGLDGQIGAATREALVSNAAHVAGNCIRDSKGFETFAARQELDRFVETTLKGILGIHSKTKMPHVGSLKNIPLADIYVAPSAVLGSKKDADHGPSTSADALSVCATTHRCVILGDPGGGKSTTSLRMIQLVSDGQRDRAFCKSLPVLIVLREWADQLLAGNLSLVQLVENVCRTRYSADAPPQAIEHLLEEGRVSLFFDGLDELLETASRARVVALVEGFAIKYPLASIVVTSRRVGYAEAPLDSSLFQEVQIAGFDAKQRREYATRWFTLEEGYTDEEQAAMISAFVKETATITDLSSNPLMLSLMCALYSSEHYIPKNRPEVYDKCSQLLFDSWDRNRNVKVTLPFEWHIMSSLDALALHFLKRTGPEATMSTSQLEQFLASYLKDRRFSTSEEARVAAASFVNFCQGRAWVLTEISAGQYSFAHATFMEFFAARQIVKTHRSVKSVAKRLGPRIARAEWDVVCQLVIQLFENVREDGSERIVQRLLQSPSSDKGEQNLLSFLHRCLSFYVPSPYSLQQIAARTVQHINACEPTEILREAVTQNVLGVSPENADRWFDAIRDEILSESIKPTHSLMVWVMIPEIFRATNQPFSETTSLLMWKDTMKQTVIEWRRDFSHQHLWMTVASDVPMDAKILGMVRSAGVSSLFAEVDILPRLTFNSIAERFLLGRESESTCSMFVHTVLSHLNSGEQFDVKTFDWFARVRVPHSLGTMHSSAQDAMLLTAMVYWEASPSKRTEGSRRSDVLHNLVRDGEVSVDGRALLTLDDLHISRPVRRLFESWASSERSLTKQSSRTDNQAALGHRLLT